MLEGRDVSQISRDRFQYASFAKLLSLTSCLALLAGLILAGGLAGCRSPQRSAEDENTLDVIKRERVLRVGYIPTPPWIIENPKTHQLSGSSVDAIYEIARSMGGYKVEFTEASWDTFIAGLQTHKYDISIAPTLTTIPRAMTVAFTQPQFYIGNSAIVRRTDKRFKTLDDIDRPGIVVATTQGEQGDEYAKAHFKHARIEQMSGGSQDLTFTEVLSGRADVALGDAWYTAQFAKRHPQVADLFANDPYNLTAVSWAVRPTDVALLNFLNTAIDDLESNGKLEQLDKKYGGTGLRPVRVWRK